MKVQENRSTIILLRKRKLVTDNTNFVWIVTFGMSRDMYHYSRMQQCFLRFIDKCVGVSCYLEKAEEQATCAIFATSRDKASYGLDTLKAVYAVQ
jgi:hypothetical protein